MVARLLAPASATRYEVTSYTVAGAERLLRVLTGQPAEIEPGLGPVPDLPPRATGPMAGLMRPVLRGELSPADAVRAYHDALAKAEIAPHRELEADLEVPDPVLRAG